MTQPGKVTKQMVAGSYACDFGYIVLGHAKKLPIVIHNCYDDPINYEINRRLLGEFGYLLLGFGEVFALKI